MSSEAFALAAAGCPLGSGVQPAWELLGLVLGLQLFLILSPSKLQARKPAEVCIQICGVEFRGNLP